LAALNLHAKLRSQLEWLPDKHKLFLWGTGLSGAPLVDQLCDLLLARALPLDDGAPRSQAEFETCLKVAKHRMSVAVQDVAEVAAPLLSAYHEARLALEKAKLAQAQAALDDMRSQLEQLVKPGFWASAPWEWLRHYPRYLKAIVYRLDKLRSGGAARDRVGQQEIWPRWQRYLEATAMPEASGFDQAALERYRWLLEELRVSLFAQPLGTSLKISAKRLDEQWAAIGVPAEDGNRRTAGAAR
jgi:ATP-dependent helicase HrpA